MGSTERTWPCCVLHIWALYVDTYTTPNYSYPKVRGCPIIANKTGNVLFHFSKKHKYLVFVSWWKRESLQAFQSSCVSREVPRRACAQYSQAGSFLAGRLHSAWAMGLPEWQTGDRGQGTGDHWRQVGGSLGGLARVRRGNWHFFGNKNTIYIKRRRLGGKVKEVIVHIPNVLIYKLSNHHSWTVQLANNFSFSSSG